jgi:hypothetical protein
MQMCFRLKERHLNTNKWKKMTVSKAAYLFIQTFHHTIQTLSRKKETAADF